MEKHFNRIVSLFLVVITLIPMISESVVLKAQEMDPNHEHSYKVVDSIKPTCTEVGKEIKKCSCGATFSENVAARGHDLVKNRVKSYDETCTKDGLLVNDCSRCEYHEEVVLPYLGHNF
ncbi:MAG: hypothetical protein IKU52_02130, partial [Clostridia bacterium]|nr:hypothetical protein [Clostridia bacterium]